MEFQVGGASMSARSLTVMVLPNLSAGWIGGLLRSRRASAPCRFLGGEECLGGDNATGGVTPVPSCLEVLHGDGRLPPPSPG